MEPRQQYPDRFIPVIFKHNFLPEIPIRKDTAFHPRIAKIKTEGCRHGLCCGRLNPQI
jgi:hypothetical protein